MPTSAPGSEPGRRVRSRGFTLLELILVIAIVALASGLTALALRDGESTRLEREAGRLAALLEGVRAESRSLGLPLRWLPQQPPAAEADFRFLGLPPGMAPPPQTWLERPAPSVTLLRPDGRDPGPGVLLGPEPMIGPQRIVLGLGTRRIAVVSDGFGPFLVEPLPDAAP